MQKKKAQLDNLGMFELEVTGKGTINVFVDAEESLGAKWVEATRIDSRMLLIEIFAKKPRKKKGG